METAEKIVEAYVRYVKRWATIANINCPGQKEVDLLAIDYHAGRRYHIEVNVSITPSFRRWRVQDLTSYLQSHFLDNNVLRGLEEYGFQDDNYTKVLVTWDWEENAEAVAQEMGIEMWRFPKIIQEINNKLMHEHSWLRDDELRTIHLVLNAERNQQ